MQFLNQSAYVIFSWLIRKKIPVILSRVSLQYNVKPNLILNTKFFISKFWCQDILYFFDDNIMGRIFTRYIFPYRHHVEITRKNKKKFKSYLLLTSEIFITFHFSSLHIFWGWKNIVQFISEMMRHEFLCLLTYEMIM